MTAPSAIDSMSLPAKLVARIRVSARERLRRRFGAHVVERDVMGARLAMPWSHRLPDYVKAFPTYGRNLVDLAEQLTSVGGPLRVVDLGANIGDSACQILARVDAEILCIDGDPYWLPFLRRNTDPDPRITVEAALVVEQPDDSALTAVRVQGTTRFVPGLDEESCTQITAAQVRARHPDFANARLIKSDIDGFDCTVVPLLAAAWIESSPVLFFEYDPELTRRAGNAQPEQVWDKLADLGYAIAVAWTNLGEPVGGGTVEELRRASRVLDLPAARRPADYWDVAVAMRDDAAGVAALRTLVATPFPTSTT